MKAKNSLTLKIDSLSYFGGRGVGRHEGLVVFVPGAAPGDVLQVQITAEKPRFLEAEIVQIIEPSPHRREAPCPVFSKCGGCAWQHVDYSVQIAQKEKILADALKKIAKNHAIPWRPFVPAPSEFHYRNRIQLQVRDGHVGFFAKRSRDLVAIEKCWIAEEKLNEKIGQLSAADRKASRLELALQPDGGVVVMPEKRDPEEALFSQVNSAQNVRLISDLIGEVRIDADWIVDLYAGAGNLTFPLAKRFPETEVTAVELSASSVAQGRRQMTDEKISWRAGDAARVMRDYRPAGIGLVVLDPPRVGASREMIHTILNWRPKQILYVSCNPTTFARDAEMMLEKGYVLDSVRGLDMFPQTEHVELIASLCAAP